MPAPTLLQWSAVPAQGNSVVANFAGKGATTGDVLVFQARSQASPTSDITPPTGWARAGVTGTFASDRFLGTFYKYVSNIATETLSVTFTGIAGGGSSRIEAHIGIVRGADPAHLNDAGAKYQNNATVPATTALATPYTVIAIAGAEFTAGNGPVPNAITGYTQLLTSQTAGGTTPVVVANSDTTGSRTGLTTIYKAVESGSLTVDAIPFTWSGTATDPKSASWVIRGLADVPPIGLPVKLGNGAAARLSYLDGTGVRKAPTSVSIWLPGFTNPSALIAKAGATMAHRGGSLNWPEFSQIAYDKSVRRGYGLLEFSCGWTSDLVPFGLGDQYLDTAAGVSGNVDPTTMTWATLSATYQNKLRPVSSGVFQPFYRLVDFLDKYTPTHTVAVDPKFGAGDATKINAMLNICDAHGGPSKIIVKFDSPITDSQLVVAAKARGYATMNYWGTEIAKLTPTYHTDKWDLIGVRYDADQAMYDAANAIGKPVWAAVIPDQAGYATAASRGADLMMCSNVAGVTPVGAWN